MEELYYDTYFVKKEKWTVGKIVKTTLKYAIYAFVVAILLLMIFGFRAYIVDGWSMQPTIGYKSIAIVNTNIDQKDLRIGDIVTFEWPNGANTHRLSRIVYKDNSYCEYVFSTENIKVVSGEKVCYYADSSKTILLGYREYKDNKIYYYDGDGNKITACNYYDKDGNKIENAKEVSGGGAFLGKLDDDGQLISNGGIKYYYTEGDNVEGVEYFEPSKVIGKVAMLGAKPVALDFIGIIVEDMKNNIIYYAIFFVLLYIVLFAIPKPQEYICYEA